jgi:hypothetical protein
MTGLYWSINEGSTISLDLGQVGEQDRIERQAKEWERAEPARQIAEEEKKAA